MRIQLILNERKQVAYYILSGEQLLHDLMSEKVAKTIIEEGTISISERITGYPLCVDGKYFIEAIVIEDNI